MRNFGDEGAQSRRPGVLNLNAIFNAEETKPIWNFFDLRAYLIMAFMMGGGIWLLNSGLVPEVFIAVFYTGLGCALALAGVLFWVMFFRYKSE